MTVVSLCLPCFRVRALTNPLQVHELYDALKTATLYVANVLNRANPTHHLPPELLTKIVGFAIDHGCEEHAKQLILLTHVCQYWRTVVLSYPNLWSIVSMKPGNPIVVSEWLIRSQNVPLTVIAEFTDTYEHAPCRYQDLASATLAATNEFNICPRHKAALSLDELLPHRSRIHDLSILLHSSDPDWDAHAQGPILLQHQFFVKTLPNLQRLDFRAIHVEQDSYAIHTPSSLFAGKLPHLTELKYLGVTGGLIDTAKNLTSCEIGSWLRAAGSTILQTDVLQTLLNNNRTLESLTINKWIFLNNDSQTPTVIPLPDLKFLTVGCSAWYDLRKILSSIHAPLLSDLDTIQLSLPCFDIRTIATGGSGCTVRFSWPCHNELDFDPMRHLGADITTLRLGEGSDTGPLVDTPGLWGFLRSLDSVRVLEFYGTISGRVQNILSVPGLLQGLEVIQVGIDKANYQNTLQCLSFSARSRMEKGKRLTAIRPIAAEGCESELDHGLREEWEKCFEEKGVAGFLVG